MARVQSFPPIADAGARILILGSMPGKASLAAGEYYAHPHNLFWRILCEVTGTDPASPYALRTRALEACGVALWDVLAACTRKGSLDSAIVDASIRVNDFDSFYRSHTRISHVFFNGAKAEACYRRHVLPMLGGDTGRLNCLRLPSTSPANASIPREHRQRVWTRTLRRALAER
jgi:hypoxanthine-DNA glycosylase